MKFEKNDNTYHNLVDVLFHEFLMCEKAFDEFVFFASNNIMGTGDSSIKFKSYNAYSEFLTRLYEFYVGCFKKEFCSTDKINHETLDQLFTFEVEKLMRNRRTTIEKGKAPSWENHISCYQENIPSEFGKEFRDIRNNTSHTDYRRAGGNRISLMEFYKKYHKFVYLLFESALFTWSGKTHKDYKIEHVEDFDFSIGSNYQTYHSGHLQSSSFFKGRNLFKYIKRLIYRKNTDN